jgi:FkbM family methyltransferase
MKKRVKSTLKNILNGSLNVIYRTMPGRYFFNRVVGTVMEKVGEVTHNGVSLKFATPNGLCDWRVRTFTSKEPETLEWIEKITPGSVLWDIGANVGLYAVYAAKKSNCIVYAFEPSVFNLELLARNSALNDLADKICIIPFPLSDKIGKSFMRLTTTEWGGALSTFDKEFGWDGKPIKKVFEFQTIGVSMDDAAQLLNIPQPEYIKIDVDGLEHFILRGGISVLKNIKEILIEVNDDFIEQAEDCHKLLTEAGLVLLEKKHSEMIANNTQGFQNSYNQIWARKTV